MTDLFGPPPDSDMLSMLGTTVGETRVQQCLKCARETKHIPLTDTKGQCSVCGSLNSVVGS